MGQVVQANSTAIGKAVAGKFVILLNIQRVLSVDEIAQLTTLTDGTGAGDDKQASGLSH